MLFVLIVGLMFDNYKQDKKIKSLSEDIDIIFLSKGFMRNGITYRFHSLVSSNESHMWLEKTK